MTPLVSTLLIPPDNYSYIIEYDRECIIIDPSQANPIISFMHSNKIRASLILATHHHADHTSGITEIKNKNKCKVAGIDNRISNIDTILCKEKPLSWKDITIQVFFLPGHTSGSAGFYFPEMESLFTGDTLFNAGCGRLFEGTPDDMVQSLETICKLPDTTHIYCGHEYTIDNLNFALSLEPDNKTLKNRLYETRRSLDRKKPSVPSTLELEKLTNPFLRVILEKDFRERIGNGLSKVEAFKKLREMKNRF